MMLTEVMAVPAAALPVSQFRDHLRLGTGFTDSGLEDSLLETYLRAALAAVEAWTGKALIQRTYRIDTDAWAIPNAQDLPVGPARSVTEVALLTADGGSTVVAPTRYRLVNDTHEPRVESLAATLPAIPIGGMGRVTFDAGFGPAWTNVPADLGHAVILLASYYYEYRHEARLGAQKIPYGVTRLLASWRPIRIGGRSR
ncbi:MAG: hypothetical protein AAGB05_15505 [Pseudomonadota bacterium]